MESWQPTRETIDQVRDAVLLAGRLEHLRVHQTARTEFFSIIAFALGGTLDGVDAFVSQDPDDTSGEHRVYWLRGNSFGSLALKAHNGPEGANEPAEVSGYVRSLHEIAHVEIVGATAEWPFSGGFPTVHPDVKIHFDNGDAVTISATARSHDGARKQVAMFVEKLLEAVARR
ncbi:MAG: hypothetical protein HY898_28455 [Deltaproteobacteria bacterium]|nr:hypothetical protein [Deltaproteobacteria bacterium]